MIPFRNVNGGFPSYLPPDLDASLPWNVYDDDYCGYWYLASEAIYRMKKVTTIKMIVKQFDFENYTHFDPKWLREWEFNIPLSEIILHDGKLRADYLCASGDQLLTALHEKNFKPHYNSQCGRLMFLGDGWSSTRDRVTQALLSSLSNTEQDYGASQDYTPTDLPSFFPTSTIDLGLYPPTDLPPSLEEYLARTIDKPTIPPIPTAPSTASPAKTPVQEVLTEIITKTAIPQISTTPPPTPPPTLSEKAEQPKNNENKTDKLPFKFTDIESISTQEFDANTYVNPIFLSHPAFAHHPKYNPSNGMQGEMKFRLYLDGNKISEIRASKDEFMKLRDLADAAHDSMQAAKRSSRRAEIRPTGNATPPSGIGAPPPPPPPNPMKNQKGPSLPPPTKADRKAVVGGGKQMDKDMIRAASHYAQAKAKVTAAYETLLKDLLDESARTSLIKPLNDKQIEILITNTEKFVDYLKDHPVPVVKSTSGITKNSKPLPLTTLQTTYLNKLTVLYKSFQVSAENLKDLLSEEKKFEDKCIEFLDSSNEVNLNNQRDIYYRILQSFAKKFNLSQPTSDDPEVWERFAQMIKKCLSNDKDEKLIDLKSFLDDPEVCTMNERQLRTCINKRIIDVKQNNFLKEDRA